MDETAGQRQRARLAEHLAARDDIAAQHALAGLRKVATSDDNAADHDTVDHNTMPALLAAARAGCTVGEISGVLRAEFGEYREPAPW